MNDWMKMINKLFDETLKKSNYQKRTDEKEGDETKKLYNHHLDKRKDFTKSTERSYDEIFCDVSEKDNSAEQITKLSGFLDEMR